MRWAKKNRIWHLIIAGLILSAALVTRAAMAEEFEDILVHIVCREGETGTPRKGSGVIISEAGHVLTARHVILGAGTVLDAKTVCIGSKGSAKTPKSELLIAKISNSFDAALLKLPVGGHDFVTFCPVVDSDRMEPIIATGFPLNSSTGTVTVRVGVLATTQPTAVVAPSTGRTSSLIETDAATTIGMSGGMVSLRRNGRMIGIVSGVEPDILGLPSYYAILPVFLFSDDFDEFGLRKADDCPPLPKVTGPFGARVGAKGPWTADQPPLDLGMSPDNGYCFLVSVWGTFDDNGDSVEVGISETTGNYVMSGNNERSGRHGALAKCVRF